jgi:ferritin-like metal-binding protein YciE
VARAVSVTSQDAGVLENLRARAPAGSPGLFASDEVLKSGIADYAFEHYEIAHMRAA